MGESARGGGLKFAIGERESKEDEDNGDPGEGDGGWFLLWGDYWLGSVVGMGYVCTRPSILRASFTIILGDGGHGLLFWAVSFLEGGSFLIIGFSLFEDLLLLWFGPCVWMHAGVFLVVVAKNEFSRDRVFFLGERCEDSDAIWRATVLS